MTEPEPVGTVAEEAAKLFAAVHVWAAGTGAASGAASDSTSHGPSDEGDAGDTPAECQWCPLCRLLRMAKSTTPDVREHLSQAAVSLALAVKGLLDDPVTTPRRETPLEKIDLTEE